MDRKEGDKRVFKTKKYSIVDGSAYNVMTGFGENYVVPYAIRLNATNSQIGLLSAVPSFLGSLFQIAGASIVDKLKDRKKIVTCFVLLQAITLLPIFFIPLISKDITMLIILFSLYSIFGNLTNPAWHSWIGQVIPDNDRSKYFSLRSKITLTSSLVSIVAAGVILNIFDKINIWVGFGILFLIAFGGRIVSWIYLKKQYEPNFIVKKKNYFSFKDFLKRMPETNFGNFAMYRSLMAVAVMIASPFFAVYMLRNLGFNYIQYTAILLIPLIFKILTVKYWGKYCGKYGTKNLMFISSFLLSFIPLIWFVVAAVFNKSQFTFPILIIVECLTGFAWGGFELTTFNYMLETTHNEKRARASAYFHVLFGTGHLVGGLIGVSLLKYVSISFIDSILFVFVISFICRMLVTLFFVNKMHDVKIKRDIDEEKLFFDMVIARPLHSVLHAASHSIIKDKRSSLR